MRPVHGRQLLEDGIFTEETNDWDEQYDDSEDDSLVTDRASVISMQTITSMHADPKIYFEDVNDENAEESTSQAVCLEQHRFPGIFDEHRAIPITEV